MGTKFLELPEAAALIHHGDTVAISGSMEMSPMALLRELIRSGASGLHLLCSGSAAINADLLIGAGCVETVEASQIILGEFGFAPHYRRAVEEGRLQVREHACPAMAAAIQAGAMGLPFIPVPGLLGTDYLQVRDDFRLIRNPYRPEEEVVVVPAIRPDVCIFHAYQADTQGNVVASRLQNNRLLAQASRHVIVTVEEVVAPGELDREKGTFIPTLYIHTVVEAPFGAYPTSCPGFYPADEAHMQTYLKAAGHPNEFEKYLQQYVFSYTRHEDYSVYCSRKESQHEIFD